MNRPVPGSATIAAAEPTAARLSVPAAADERGLFLGSWLAGLCARIDGVTLALLVHREGADNTFVASALWPRPDADYSALAEVARHALAEGSEIAVPALGVRAEPPGSAAARIGVPYRDGEGAPFAALALELVAPPGTRLASEAALGQCAWAGGWLVADHAARHAAAVPDRAAGAALTALDLVALVGEHARAADAALALANELAAWFGCPRVAIGLARCGRVRLTAISHAAIFDPRSRAAETLDNAMNEAFYQAAPVLLPEDPAMPPAIALAHRELAREASSPSVLSVVMRGRESAVGVITLERGDMARPLGAAEAERLGALAAVLGPVLELQVEREQWLAGRPRRLWLATREALMRPDRPVRRVALVAVLALPLLLAIMPGTFEVSARAVLEGRVQRAIVAPYEGYVGEARARAGDTVRKGDLLARLEDRDLQLERARWQSEVGTLRAKYDDAMAQHARADVMVLEAQMGEARAQLALAEDKLARSRIVAPFDGVIVSGDLSQSLGSPVERGKPLFEIAPRDGFRVILQVDERDVRFVRAGQHGRVVLSGLPTQVLPLAVTRTTAVATADEGRNFFRTEATLDRGDARLRPGMEGVARVDAGTRPLLWIWTRTLVEWLRVFAWKWLP